eukprot:gene31669-66959_t
MGIVIVFSGSVASVTTDVQAAVKATVATALSVAPERCTCPAS